MIFYALNGYLVGREYFEAVAIRRNDPAEAKAVRSGNASKVFVTGVVGAGLLSIPIVNLIAPVIAAAAMTHRYHSVAGRKAD